MCRACGRIDRGAVCRACAATLRPGVERRLPGGLLVRPVLVHDGAARRLVHHLKYRGLAAAAGPLADAMAAVLPPGAAALVPVPRVLGRLWRYGTDPAEVLASALAERCGVPVRRLIARPLWWPGRAGPAGARRGVPSFRAGAPSGPGVVLVDDVLTTGATLAAAARAVPGARWAVTATGPAEPAAGR